jgi:carbonic anhydrase
MTASTQQELRSRIGASAGMDADWQLFSVVDDQLAALEEDVQRVRTHPLIPNTILVGGFMYDVDTGLLDQKF